MKYIHLELFEDYLTDIKISKAEGTFKFYENHLQHFGRFIYERNINKLEEIDRSVIVDYITMMKKTVENITINKRVGIIKRCFLFYGIDEHYVHSISKLKEKRRSYDMIEEHDLKKIINYINKLPEEVGNNLMYKGIIFLFINTGVRLTELYNIEKKNVNLKELEILLTKTKNGEDRLVYFRPVIKDLVGQLLKEESSHNFLLHNRIRNRPISYKDVVYLFNKIKKDLNMKKLHPHMFRHTFATNLLVNGVDIKTVMDLMGHNNLSTTQRYMHSSKEHAKKSYLEKYKY